MDRWTENRHVGRRSHLRPKDTLTEVTFPPHNAAEYIEHAQLLAMDYPNMLTADAVRKYSTIYKFHWLRKGIRQLGQQTLWKLVYPYGAQVTFVNLIRNQYQGMTCRVVHSGQLTQSFSVLKGVRQGYLFSPIFTELSARFAQNDQPVIHRGVDDKLHDLFRA